MEDPKDAHDSAAGLGMRERFSLPESLRVLSHWDLGVIERVREFRRGSRRSPKLRIAADSGEYLLKRRAPGRDDLARVTLAHDLIELLAAGGYPIAPVVPTRRGASFVELDGRLYELFRYVDSTGYPKNADAAGAAGEALARLHLTTAGATPSDPVEGSSFHASRLIESAFDQIPGAVGAVEPDHDVGELSHTCKLLRKGYREAARRVEASGWSSFPRQVIHGDWHPGNVLFRSGPDGSVVAAVLDFDSARIEPRVVDVANGLLQFTMLMGAPDDPVAWPEGFDVKRLDAFLRRYDETLRREGLPGSELSVEEQSSLPWLMIEALVSESALPIAATGSFASIRGSAFLRMVENKVDWIWRRSARLKRLLAA